VYNDSNDTKKTQNKIFNNKHYLSYDNKFNEALLSNNNIQSSNELIKKENSKNDFCYMNGKGSISNLKKLKEIIIGNKKINKVKKAKTNKKSVYEKSVINSKTSEVTDRMSQISEFKLNDNSSSFSFNSVNNQESFFNLREKANQSTISTSYTTPMIYPPNNDPNKVPKKGPKILCHTCTLKFSCKFCNKTFSRLNNLVIHQKAHFNKKEFKCNVCDQVFSRKHDLTRHQRIHSGEKPFHCEICGKSYSRMDALKRHERINLNNNDHSKVIISSLSSEVKNKKSSH
jgi:uncharacterized Zn-finger protein